jgi:hypothetical protein
MVEGVGCIRRIGYTYAVPHAKYLVSQYDPVTTSFAIYPILAWIHVIQCACQNKAAACKVRGLPIGPL